MRATSKRLCFIASMARSKRTLSGCLEPTLANGLLTFLLVQPMLNASAPSKTIVGKLRDIRTSLFGSEPGCCGMHLRRRSATFLTTDRHDRGRALPKTCRELESHHTFCSVASVAAFNNFSAFVFGSPLPNTALPA